MTFGEALNALDEGKQVWRKGWDGKLQFIFKTQGREIELEQFMSFKNGNSDALRLARKYHWHTGNKVIIKDHIDSVYYDGSIECGFVATQSDMQANDWAIIE